MRSEHPISALGRRQEKTNGGYSASLYRIMAWIVRGVNKTGTQKAQVLIRARKVEKLLIPLFCPLGVAVGFSIEEGETYSKAKGLIRRTPSDKRTGDGEFNPCRPPFVLPALKSQARAKSEMLSGVQNAQQERLPVFREL